LKRCIKNGGVQAEIEVPEISAKFPPRFTKASLFLQPRSSLNTYSPHSPLYFAHRRELNRHGLEQVAMF
jgi:hypothetical protein